MGSNWSTCHSAQYRRLHTLPTSNSNAKQFSCVKRWRWRSSKTTGLLWQERPSSECQRWTYPNSIDEPWRSVRGYMDSRGNLNRRNDTFVLALSPLSWKNDTTVRNPLFDSEKGFLAVHSKPCVMQKVNNSGKSYPYFIRHFTPK